MDLRVYFMLRGGGLHWFDTDVMPLELLRVSHPEYEALRNRGGSLAAFWRVGHVILTLALPQAIAWPLGMIAVAWFDPEFRGRVFTVGGLFCVVIAAEAAIGFGLKRYAVRRAGYLDALSHRTPQQ